MMYRYQNRAKAATESMYLSTDETSQIILHSLLTFSGQMVHHELGTPGFKKFFLNQA